MTTVPFEVNPSGVGVRLLGLHLSVPMSAVVTVEIQRLLHQYKLVVVEQQVLSDIHLCDFAHRFGPPFVSAFGSPVLGGSIQIPDIVVVGNRADEYEQSFLGHQEVLPHSDHQWLRCPSAASLLYAVETAPGSASTTWTDMAAAYNLLPHDLKDRIEGLKLITYNPFHRPFGAVKARYVDSRTEQVPGEAIAHPLVRTHPVTAEKVLYLHAAYEMELVGVGYAEGSALIEELHAHMANVTCKYEHTWKVGDLVLWDNQATVHYRPAFMADVRRVLKRVTIAGGVPF